MEEEREGEADRLLREGIDLAMEILDRIRSGEFDERLAPEEGRLDFEDTTHRGDPVTWCC